MSVCTCASGGVFHSHCVILCHCTALSVHHFRTFELTLTISVVMHVAVWGLYWTNAALHHIFICSMLYLTKFLIKSSPSASLHAVFPFDG